MAMDDVFTEIITDAQANASKVSYKRTRPTEQGLYGGSPLNADGVKALFDAYPDLLKRKINKIIVAITNGDFYNAIKVVTEQNSVRNEELLSDVITALQAAVSGNSDEIGTITNVHNDIKAVDLATVINSFYDLYLANKATTNSAVQIMSSNIGDFTELPAGVTGTFGANETVDLCRVLYKFYELYAANKDGTDKAFSGVSFNRAEGKITFSKIDGSTPTVVDLPTETLVKSGRLSDDEESLILTLDNDVTITISLSALSDAITSAANAAQAAAAAAQAAQEDADVATAKLAVIDTVPTADSTNLVTSGGVATALSNALAGIADAAERITSYDVLQKRFENLVMASKGIVYNEDANASVDYTKQVPAGAQKWATLDSIGGNVDKVISAGKNVLDLRTFNNTSNGVTYKYNPATGKIAISGTSTSQYSSSNRKEIISALKVGTTYRVSSTYSSSNDHPVGYVSLTFNDGTATSYRSNGSVFTMTPNVSSATAYFQLRDVGIVENEECFMQLEIGETATAFSPYRDPIDTPVPAEVKALPGYGWSAGTAYNEVDYANKKYIQRVGMESDVLVELATPIETDISAYFPEDNFIEVEAGGTLTFHQQEDAQNPVPNTETFVIKVEAAI